MARYGFALVVGLLGLALADASGPRRAEPRMPEQDGWMTLSLEDDLSPVLQKGKEKAARRDYSLSNRVRDQKGKSGEFHMGTTPNGRKINAHLKNGKVHKMSLTKKSDGKQAHHKRVVKAKNRPGSVKRLPSAAKGVRKVALAPDLEEDAETVRVGMRQGFQFIGFIIQTLSGIWFFWIPIALVEQNIIDDAMDTGCGEDEVEVRAPETLPLLPTANRPRSVAALSSRRPDLEECA